MCVYTHIYNYIVYIYNYMVYMYIHKVVLFLLHKTVKMIIAFTRFIYYATIVFALFLLFVVVTLLIQSHKAN